jgi:hypothetical protein
VSAAIISSPLLWGALLAGSQARERQLDGASGDKRRYSEEKEIWQAMELSKSLTQTSIRMF